MIRVIILIAALLMAGCEAKQKGTVVAYQADWCASCQSDKPELAKLPSHGVAVQSVECNDREVPHYIVYDSKGNKIGEANSLIALIKLLRILKWLL